MKGEARNSTVAIDSALGSKKGLGLTGVPKRQETTKHGCTKVGSSKNSTPLAEKSRQKSGRGGPTESEGKGF